MKKLKEKLNNEKRIIVIILFAVFANCNLFAVDVAPRISDKEIVQNLADIKSEFKMVYGTIDNLRKEIKSEFKVVYAEFKTVYSEIDNLEKNIDLKFDKVYAQMEGNKNELNTKFDAKFDGLSGKFDLMINILWAVLASAVSLIIGLLIHHFKVIGPLIVKYNEINKTVKNIDYIKNPINEFMEKIKVLSQNDKKVKNLLQQCNLL